VRVLVVDDQERFREVACRVVEQSDGFSLVGEATCGAEAVAAADDLRPDLVLMDVRMPGMSGIEAERRILASRPGTCVVLVSAYGSPTIASKERLTPTFLRAAWDLHRRPSGTVPETTVPDPRAETTSS